MKPIILHIGNRVHHKTLGEGIVISVNDDYCTARFGEKEANFLIPDAFVRGYLTSPDAKIGSEDTSENTDERPIVEVKQNEEELSAKRFGTGCAITCFILISAFICIPLGIFFVYCNEVLLGVMMFVVFLLSIPMTFWVVKRTNQDSYYKHSSNEQTQIAPDTELMIGMLGAEVIDRELKSAKAESEQRRYDSLYWQESIRDKNPRHDFDYDKMDD